LKISNYILCFIPNIILKLMSRKSKVISMDLPSKLSHQLVISSDKTSLDSILMTFPSHTYLIIEKCGKKISKKGSKKSSKKSSKKAVKKAVKKPVKK